MIIGRLNWDSDFFGLRIGRACISSVEESEALMAQKDLAKEDYDLVYVFGNQRVGFSAENAKLVDEKVVYVLNDPFCGKSDPNVIVWDANKGVSDDLLHLALLSGKYSRFRLDKGFPLGSYERLYSRWIEQSVNRVIASEVFCYMVEDVPRGMVTLDREEGVGTIGLVAIHEDFQHQGIGTAMMRHVIQYTETKRCMKLSVATQFENTPACRLYGKNGFVVESVTNVWHWWL